MYYNSNAAGKIVSFTTKSGTEVLTLYDNDGCWILQERIKNNFLISRNWRFIDCEFDFAQKKWFKKNFLKE